MLPHEVLQVLEIALGTVGARLGGREALACLGQHGLGLVEELGRAPLDELPTATGLVVADVR